MSFDPYSSCPCGSGKKFKWCCQPIHQDIDRAFQQDTAGQHDTALRLMDEVVKQHPANPEAWGRKAQLLYQNDKVEEAETALNEALKINPRYPFGHLLRGLFRFHEGEVPGALLLFRKAAEYYDPDARDMLGQIYSLIAECEQKLNRPVALWAALRLALRYHPGREDLQAGFDANFGDKGRLPAAARRDYTFLSPGAGAGSERLAAWQRAIKADFTKLGDAVVAFEQLTAEDPADAAAWYNLGLCRAWLGDNCAAVEALDRYVALEPDEAKAGAAWALAEVLRCGHGLHEDADYHEHSYMFQIREPNRVLAALQAWEEARRIVGTQVNEEAGVLSAIVVEALPTLTVGPGIPATARLACYLMVAGDVVRLWGPNRDSLERVRHDLQEAAGPGLSEPHARTDRIIFSDVSGEAQLFPTGPMNKDDYQKQAKEQAARYFEDTWVHRPLRSLSGSTPLDAAGHAVLRKKLLGVVQFLQDCAALSPVAGYDFDRLRRKLGLIKPVAADGAPADIAAMGAAELGALQVEALNDEQLEQAWQTASRLDAQELAGHLAQALAARPPKADKPDRYGLYHFLVQRALTADDTDKALDYVNEGEKADCAYNEGRRRNDYELRRAQVHARRGEADAAFDVYARLIERVPDELRYRGNAVESMLTLKQGARALQFAEAGLVKARAQNSRDAEQHFLELVAAAKKQVG